MRAPPRCLRVLAATPADTALGDAPALSGRLLARSEVLAERKLFSLRSCHGSGLAFTVLVPGDSHRRTPPTRFPA